MIGPAGATVIIPIFIAYLKYPVKNTIGTTSALAITTSLAGVLCYIFLGLNNINLPEFSIGYINLLQFIFLTPTSVFISSYSANLAKKIDVNKLKALQVIVISYIGLQMIGVFDMLLTLI